MISRWMERELQSALKARRVVNLTGARQCGKTTLVGMTPISKVRRYTFDDDKIRNAAQDDVIGFVDRNEGETIVIDEVQKVPEILNAIKIKVDQDNSRGQYLLTGSANLHFVKSITDSLAGRVGRVRLRTLALGEILGGKGDFIARAFRRDFPAEIVGFNKKRIINLAVQGGYPEAIEMDVSERRKWYRSYLEDIIVKDLRDVTEIRKIDVMYSIAEWLLAYSSKFFEMAELSAKVGVGKETADNYIAALKTMYLFDEIKPWTKSDYSKLGKRSKRFAADSGLVANILGWTGDSIYMDNDRSGKIIETWVYQNLASLVDLDGECEISQYRDSNKREIDFIIERGDGSALGIEVKSGASFGIGDFKNLKWFAKNLAPGAFTGIVLYSGEQTLRFGEGFYAVPLAALGI